MTQKISNHTLLTDWLTLHCAAPFALRRIVKCLHNGYTPRQLMAFTFDRLASMGFSNKAIEILRHPPGARIRHALDWLAQDPLHHIISWMDNQYPSRLREISAPPLVLYVKGDATILNMTQIAVVGSRRPTYSGIENTQWLSANLARLGLGITSGLALGIDGAAHRGALNAKGSTIAVLGSGLKQIYPKRHIGLAEEIVAAGGALLSEFPLDAPPLPAQFPQRNRVMSGLSLGTLVVEAHVKSGSLVTARHALEQGREVFAVPGSIHNPLARGCHRLISQGAKLVEKVEDVIEELPECTIRSAGILDKANPLDQDGDNRSMPGGRLNALLRYFDFEKVSVDQLIQRSGWSASEVTSGCMALQFEGLIKPVPGGCYERVIKKNE